MFLLALYCLSSRLEYMDRSFLGSSFFFKKFHSRVKLCILDVTQYLPRQVQMLLLFFFPRFMGYFILNAWLSIDGQYSKPASLSLGRKRVSQAIGSRFLCLHKSQKIILLIFGIRFFGRGNTLHTCHSLDSRIVFIIIVFPFRERCLWFCNLTLFLIFCIHFVVFHLFVIYLSLLK